MASTLLLLLTVLLPMCIPVLAEAASGGSVTLALDRLTIRSASSEDRCSVFPNFQLTHRTSFHATDAHCEFRKRTLLGPLNFSYDNQGSSIQGLNHLNSLTSTRGRGHLHLSNATPLLDDRLTADFDVYYREPSSPHASGSRWGKGLGAQVTLKGNLSGMKYGAEFGYFGKDSGTTIGSTPQDRSGGRFVWEWELTNVKPTVEISRFFDNVENDPSQPRTVTTREQFSVNWHRPHWPLVTLDYNHEYKETVSNQIGLMNDSISTDRIMTKFSYGQTSWESYVNSQSSFTQSSHEANSDQLVAGSSFGTTLHPFKPIQFMPNLGMTRTSNPREETLTEQYFAKFGSSLRIAKTLTLTPGFEYIQLFNRPDALETETIFAKLGSSYVGEENSLTVSMFGGFKVMQDSTDVTNQHTYDFSFSVDKGIQNYFHFPHRMQTLSLKLTHNQLVDNITRDASSSQTAAMLFLRFIP